MKENSVQKVRKDLPFLEGITYLDSAAVSPAPVPVIQSMNEYFSKYPYNYGVGVFSGSTEVTRKLNEARRKVAEFIGAGSDEVVFTKNTTEAINLVARGLRWSSGDGVVATNIEHQSNLLPWMRLAKEFGVNLKIVKADREGMVDPKQIENNIGPNTKLITVTHVSNVFGTIQKVEEIAEIAKKHGILYMVDAAQSDGRIPLNVRAIGCDFMAFCGRKALMGPQGTGFLYGRRPLLEMLEPLNIGGRAANVISESSYRLTDLPYRFEAGILNTPGVIGLGQAIDYINEIGIENIRLRLRELSKLMINGLEEVEGIQIYGARDAGLQGGIISWNIDGMDCHKIARSLDEKWNIYVETGFLGTPLAFKDFGVNGVVRTSVHYYNTEEDLEKLFGALRELVKRSVGRL